MPDSELLTLCLKINPPVEDAACGEADEHIAFFKTHGDALSLLTSGENIR